MNKGTVSIPRSELSAKIDRVNALQRQADKLLVDLENKYFGSTVHKKHAWRQPTDNR